MNGKRVWLLVLTVGLVLALTSAVFATPLLRVDVPDKATWNALQSEGFDIINGPDGQDQNSLYIMGWPEDMSRLQQFSYTVFIDDMEAYNRENLGSTLDDMGGYATYSEILTWMDNFCADNPGIVEGPITIGYSYQGREINVFKISDNPGVDEDETEVLINAAIHAREVVTPLTCMTFASYLVNNYGTDPRVTDLINNTEIYLMPLVNPDGYYHNEVTDPNGGGMQRKNMSPPDGVDLNRNYDYKWGLNDIGSSGNQYSETYRGPSAGSEESTQVVKAFINDREFAAVVNYHSYSDLILLPWGWTYTRPPNWDIYMAWGNYMNETLGYEVGGPEIIYLTNGDAQDWQAAGDVSVPTSADYHMWAFTYEVGNWSQGGFWPSWTTGQQLAAEQIEPMMRFCEVSANPFIFGAPVPPVMTIPDEVPPAFTATWTHDDPNGNDAVSYDLAELQNPITTDGAESSQTVVWDRNGAVRTTNREYSGSYSYWFGEANNLNNDLTSYFSMAIDAPTTLSFYTWYDIEVDWDYAYVMVSTDGVSFETIPGNITTNTNPHGTNIGNGITGSSGGWIQGTFSLNDYVGERVWIKIAYYTDGGVTEEGFYVDDITPIVGFEQMTLLADDITQPSFDINYGVIPEPFTAYFIANATDAEGQTSSWSDIDEVLISGDPPDFIFDLTGINTLVGAQGGTITYSASLQTFVGTPFNGYQYWTMAVLPNGNDYGPISTRDVNIPAYADIYVPLMTVEVPGFAPNGQYTLIGNIGLYPSIMINDSFSFLKLGLNNGDGQSRSEWAATGWPEDVVDSAASLPEEFIVETAFPNPFNPTVTVPFALPTAGEVSIVVFNTLGRTVYEQQATFNSGRHLITVDGSALSSGVYLISVSHNGASQVQKVVLMK